MWEIIISALGQVVKWLLTGGMIKWVAMAVLYGVGTILVALTAELLPDWFGTNGLSEGFALFGPATWYFWDYIQGTFALSMLFGAFVTRFLVRRIPFIG